MNAIAQHRALPHKKAALPKHFLALARRFARDVDSPDHIRPQQQREDARIHFIRLYLRLGDDACFERVRHHDVVRWQLRFEQLKKPVPIHRRLERNATTRESPHELGKLVRRHMVDAPLGDILSLLVYDVIHAVSLVVINADEGLRWCADRSCEGRRVLFFGAHSTTTLPNRPRHFDRSETLCLSAFMSPDPVFLTPFSTRRIGV